MTLDQFVAGATGVLVPFLVQLLRDRLFQLEGRQALAAAVLASFLVTLGGYFVCDPTPTVREFLTNAGLCFATAQALYNALTKQTVSRMVGTKSGE